jgi:dTDP-4-dehydrorhamnose 3,5-epimerase
MILSGQSDMDGVSLHPLKQIPNPKGDLYHALRSFDEGYVGFGEAYFTQIISGCTKGWKRHNRMTLNLVVVHGKVKFVIYDERNHLFEEVILSPESNYQRLTIAPGLWMAFHGMGEGVSTVMDIIPEPHDPSEADNMELSKIDYQF